MSFEVTYTRAHRNLHAELVTVEVHFSGGLPKITLIGLPESAVKESKDRVRSALLQLKFTFPPSRLTINLAPADLPKEGGHFDLAIAIAILSATKQLIVKNGVLKDYELAGELKLSGELGAARGILPFALATKKAGKKLILPRDNAAEAALVKDLTILPADHLLEVCEHLANQKQISIFSLPSINDIDKNIDINIKNSENYIDFSELIGHQQAKRVLEIAAAGQHSLLMVGPPGSGKTMLAKCLPSILPIMDETEAFETATINSLSRQGFKPTQWRKRPLRSPHHTASTVALIGGGTPPRPGEISLAHHGVLFLDELPEFQRQVLEALREPLESGRIIVSRAAYQAEFPADFQLIAAMNPCPCGYFEDKQMRCCCTIDQVQRYQRKISGPLLDRIDLHLYVPRVALSALTDAPSAAPNISSLLTIESSENIRLRVDNARQRQLQRIKKVNAKLSSIEAAHCAQLSNIEKDFLKNAATKLNLSPRGYYRLLKVARTIADLEDCERVEKIHLTEALSYRVPLKNLKNN